MDQALQNRLKTEFRDAMHGNHFRSSTFVSDAQVALGQCEWLEAYCANPARGWNVRRMIWSPPLFAGDEATIQQIHASDAYDLTFADAFLRVHDYQTAQPLLNYKLDENDTGSLTQATHYRDFARAEGIAFNGDQIVLPVNGFITGDGVFAAGSHTAIRDAHALRQTFNTTAAQEKRQSAQRALGALSTTTLPQNANHKAIADSVIYGYFKQSIDGIEWLHGAFSSNKWIGPHYNASRFDLRKKNFDKNITTAFKVMGIDRSYDPKDVQKNPVLADTIQFEFLVFRYFHALMLNHLKTNPENMNNKKMRGSIDQCLDRMTRCLSALGVDQSSQSDHILVRNLNDELRRLFYQEAVLEELARKIAAYDRDALSPSGGGPAATGIGVPTLGPA